MMTGWRQWPTDNPGDSHVRGQPGGMMRAQGKPRTQTFSKMADKKRWRAGGDCEAGNRGV